MEKNRRQSDGLMIEVASNLKNLSKNLADFIERHEKESIIKTDLLKKTAHSLDQHLTKHSFGLKIARHTIVFIGILVGWLLDAPKHIVNWFR